MISTHVSRKNNITKLINPQSLPIKLLEGFGDLDARPEQRGISPWADVAGGVGLWGMEKRGYDFGLHDSNNKQFEVGIIGAGAITTTLHLPLLSAMKNTKPKFIADLFEPKELGKLYKINSYKIDNLTNLPNCDIILIATPVGVRNEYINEFSKRGIPIFTEKPFALDIDTHEQFLSNSKFLGCNYMKIWYNTSKMFEKIITNNTFGEIKKIIVNEGGIVGKTNRGPETYQSNKKLSGGISRNEIFKYIRIFDKQSKYVVIKISKNTFYIKKN